MTFHKKKYQDLVKSARERFYDSFFNRKPIAGGKFVNTEKIKFGNKELFFVDDDADDKIEVVNDVASYMRWDETLAEWNGSTLRVYSIFATGIVGALYFSHSGKLEREFMPVLLPGGFRPNFSCSFLSKYPLILDTQTGDVNYDVEKYVKEFLAARKPNGHYFKIIQKYISKVPENLHHKIAKKALKLEFAS